MGVGSTSAVPRRSRTVSVSPRSSVGEHSQTSDIKNAVANSIGELSSVPIAKDAIGGLETALSSLAVGFLVFLLIGELRRPPISSKRIGPNNQRSPAGPLTLFAFVNDAFRPLPSLASKTSIALSFLSGTFALAGYVATVVVFGSLGAAVVVAGEAPGVEGSAGRGVAVRMAVSLTFSLACL